MTNGGCTVRTTAAVLAALGHRLRRTSGHDAAVSSTQSPTPALVSVVVTVSQTEAPFLGECLRSLRRQGGQPLEVLVAPHGAQARVLGSARRLTAADEHARLLPEPSPTMAAARNRGFAESRGDFVAFVRAGDVVPGRALTTLARHLQGSGSDFAVGMVATEDDDPSAEAAWRALRGARLALSDVPTAVADTAVEGKLFRSSFLERSRLRFDDDTGATAPAMVEAYLQAAAFDRVAVASYRSLARGTGRPIGTFVNPYDQLQAWCRRNEAILDVVRRRGSREVQLAWLASVLGTDALPFLDESERATSDQWATLVHSLRDLLARGGEQALPQVPVEARIKIWLASRDRRDDLEALVMSRWYTGASLPTVVTDGVPYADLPLAGERSDEPPWLRALTEAETPLTARLAGQAWSDPHTLVLVLHAFVSQVGMMGPPVAAVRLVEVDTGEGVELPVTVGTDPEVTRYAAESAHSHDHGVLTAVVDTRPLAAQAVRRGPMRWLVEVTLTVQGVTRTGTITDRATDGSAGSPTRRAVDGALVGVGMRDGDVVLAADPPRLWLGRAEVSGRAVAGSLLTDQRPPSAVAAVCGDVEVTSSTVAAPRSAEERRFTLVLPAQPAKTLQRWHLRAHAEAAVPIAWPADVPTDWLGTGPSADLALRRTQDGHVALVEVAGVAALESVELDEGSLTVVGRWLGRAPERWEVGLSGRRAWLPGHVLTSTAEGFSATVPLRHDEWGLGVSNAPLGTYRVLLRTPDDDGDKPVLVGERLAGELPQLHRSRSYRLRVVRGQAGRAQIALHNPYADDELGTRAQRLLLERSLAANPPADESVVFLQSYDGQAATDSPLAIHQELRRSRPDLRLYWGAANPSTRLPEGAEPVLVRSRAWYEILRRAGHVVVNTDLPRWFERRPGQKVLQTFHGYPAKSMGIRLWQAKDFTPRRIDSELRRTSAEWSMILTPAPEMDQHYRREYAYTGPIQSHGYPRDDVLVSSQAPTVRARTRALLGIRPDQKAVLYAPTWRDDLARTYRSAAAVHYLDVEDAAAALGPDAVLLLRGHRFHSTPAGRRPDRVTDASVVDVTDYPEINDLILAVDAAALDYSSLRFDFALTGRPMVFLVPDLEAYTTASRGFLFDYRETAPGPLVTTTEEAVEALSDLDALTATYRDQYAAFNARFNYLQDGTSTRRAVEAFFAGQGETASG